MNRMTIYIILGLLALSIIAYFIFRQKPKSELDNYFISTQSQSNDRVKNLNLDKSSEDASYILDTNKLSIPSIEKLEIANFDPQRPDREAVVVDASESGSERLNFAMAATPKPDTKFTEVDGAHNIVSINFLHYSFALLLLTKHFSLIGQWHSQFGWGGGLRWQF